MWVPITIFAAIFQTIRTALQKNLKQCLSTHAVTYTRYAFGLPFAVFYLLTVLLISNESLPILTSKFLLFCLLGGIVQILGTSALVAAFSYKNFAVSSTYAKSEALLAAFLGVILFNDYLSWSGFFIIVLGMVGVGFMSLKSKNDYSSNWKFRDLFETGPILGLTSGLFFALTSLCVRHASLSLGSGEFVVRAAFTLVVMVSIQVAILSCYLYIQEKQQFRYLITYWKPASLVGLTAILGSIGWFTAMTLQNVAYVKMVGQIELILSIFISLVFFKERISIFEFFGIVIVLFSIIGLAFLK